MTIPSQEQLKKAEEILKKYTGLVEKNGEIIRSAFRPSADPDDLEEVIAIALDAKEKEVWQEALGAVPWIDPATCSQIFLKKICNREVCNKCDYRAANNAARQSLIAKAQERGVKVEGV